MCTLSAKLNVHRPRTKYVDVGEGQPVVQEAAQAYESPDQETDQTPAQPFWEDTEGDPHTGEGEGRRGEIADSQTEERY